MKYLFYVSLGVGVCGIWIFTLAMAYGAGVKHATAAALKTAGFTRDHAKLYGRSAKILNRLAALTDLDGAMAGDQLSPESRQLVTDWVRDYKGEITKV
jgi:hypothetical protein